MSLWDNLKEKASETAKKASEGLGTLKDKTTLKFRLYQLESQIRQVAENQRAAYELMGRRIYEMHRSGQVTDSALLASCGEIEASLRRTEELRQEETRLQAEFEAEQRAKAAAAAAGESADAANPRGDPSSGGGTTGAGSSSSGGDSTGS